MVLVLVIDGLLIGGPVRSDLGFVSLAKGALAVAFDAWGGYRVSLGKRSSSLKKCRHPRSVDSLQRRRRRGRLLGEP